MKIHIDKVYLCVIGLLVTVLGYVLHSYQAALNTEIGFIYHPETEQIYEVELTAWVGHETLLRRLSPFSKTHYGVTGVGEHLGTFPDIIELSEKDRFLRESDIQTWTSNRLHSSLAALNEFNRQDIGLFDWSYLDIAYVVRTDVDRTDDFLKLLPNINGYVQDSSKYLLTIDAFLARQRNANSKHEVEILTESILARGPVASYLKLLGVNDPHFGSVDP